MAAAATSTTRSQRIIDLLTLTGQRLEADLATFHEHPRFPELYPHMLRELCANSRAGTRGMAHARERAIALGDPISLDVAKYLAKHIQEETGHFEWILDDLEALGFDREEEARKPPSHYVSALLGTTYFWVDQYHPVTVLGHLLVFEGHPPTVQFLEGLMERHSLRPEAFSFYLEHAKLDPFHAADIIALINRLDLTQEQEDGLILAALHTQIQTHNCLKGVLERA